MSNQSTQATAAPQDSNAVFGISEIVPAQFRRMPNPPTGRRLNLVIPCISEQTKSFGGPATALRLFERLTPEFDYVRIVVTHEMESQVHLCDWPHWVVDHGGIAPRSLALLGNRKTTLSISATDFFVATYWSTAVYVKHAIAHQTEWFPEVNRRFVYLIQEYEPAFFAGGARYEYAKSTYRDDGSVIAVFNSRPVANYFRNLGLQFSEQYAFDPMFHPQLREIKIELGRPIKQRLILVYGRPGFDQNGFDLIVEALRVWATTYSRAQEWSLVSAGWPHIDLTLNDKIVLRSLGTLPLHEYALYLSRCWTGLSFSFNASTSYSAREMAEFGAWVITNQFEYRKPSELPRNVICVDEATPECVAEKLASCCEQYQPSQTAVAANLSPAFKDHGDEFPFVSDLLNSWSSA